VLVVSAMALAACSSSSSKTSGGTTTTSGGATTVAPSSGTTTPAATPTGAPIKIMQTGTNTSSVFGFPETAAGAQAAAKAINSAGGIGGRPVTIVVCNDQFQSTVAVQCANQAVSSHVSAVLGGR
jgi:hypothetical protein